MILPQSTRPMTRDGRRPELPVAVIGAGPVGLAAAAHLLETGQTPLVLEAGDAVGWSVRRWGHVRLFSPWRYLIDDAAAVRLETRGWTRPPADEIPTGRELIERYVEPLGDSLSEHILTGARVTDIGRRGFDVMKTPGREAAPFDVRFAMGGGGPRSLLARAVIDASGTYVTPNPIGAGGLPAPGEKAAGELLHYGIPDVPGADRAAFAGRRIAVVGAGHTAFGALLSLSWLQRESPETRVTWVVRGSLAKALHGGGDADALAERGRLHTALAEIVAGGRLQAVEGFRVASLERDGDAVTLVSEDDGRQGPFDRVVVATGYRPDVRLTRELRLDLDPSVEAPRALAPMIDPNLHSCGTVPPHGYAELAHPEPGFFTVGMKSYGRAPTFLLLTGYEQVRSVSSHLAGDEEAARAVKLELPETGVCSTDPEPVLATAAATGGDDGRPTGVTGADALPAGGCCGGGVRAGTDPGTDPSVEEVA